MNNNYEIAAKKSIDNLYIISRREGKDSVIFRTNKGNVVIYKSQKFDVYDVFKSDILIDNIMPSEIIQCCKNKIRDEISNITCSHLKYNSCLELTIPPKRRIIYKQCEVCKHFEYTSKGDKT